MEQFAWQLYDIVNEQLLNMKIMKIYLHIYKVFVKGIAASASSN